VETISQHIRLQLMKKALPFDRAVEIIFSPYEPKEKILISDLAEIF
jgi:hypothetical protein